MKVVTYLLGPARDARGPIFIDELEVRRACPDIPREVVTRILTEVLCHPPAGANQNFSRPTDAPVPDDPNRKNLGHDFFLRPLLRHSHSRFLLLDRSVCAPACLEALLTALRPEKKRLDDKVGAAVERFLEREFASHGIPTTAGDYDVDGQHGECDLVVETPDAVIFFEMKKKALTRRSRAGSDVHLLLDLAGSLLGAQVQAGWYEVRLRRHGQLNLKRSGATSRLELNGCQIERVAVTLLDFGAFQDRTLLTRFLEGAMNAQFTPVDQDLKKKFDELNSSLTEIRKQLVALHPGDQKVNQPFFNCWFLSIPHLLVLLDNTKGGVEFKAAL